MPSTGAERWLTPDGRHLAPDAEFADPARLALAPEWYSDVDLAALGGGGAGAASGAPTAPDAAGAALVDKAVCGIGGEGAQTGADTPCLLSLGSWHRLPGHRTRRACACLRLLRHGLAGPSQARTTPALRAGSRIGLDLEHWSW